MVVTYNTVLHNGILEEVMRVLICGHSKSVYQYQDYIAYSEFDMRIATYHWHGLDIGRHRFDYWSATKSPGRRLLRSLDIPAERIITGYQHPSFFKNKRDTAESFIMVPGSNHQDTVRTVQIKYACLQGATEIVLVGHDYIENRWNKAYSFEAEEFNYTLKRSTGVNGESPPARSFVVGYEYRNAGIDKEKKMLKYCMHRYQDIDFYYLPSQKSEKKGVLLHENML